MTFLLKTWPEGVPYSPVYSLVHLAQTTDTRQKVKKQHLQQEFLVLTEQIWFLSLETKVKNTAPSP